MRTTTIETILNKGLVEAIDDLNAKIKTLNLAKKLFEDIVLKENKKE